VFIKGSFKNAKKHKILQITHRRINRFLFFWLNGQNGGQNRLSNEAIKRSIIIIRGSSGWAKKLIVQ
jgi:hypothetical protein